MIKFLEIFGGMAIGAAVMMVCVLIPICIVDIVGIYHHYNSTAKYFYDAFAKHEAKFTDTVGRLFAGLGVAILGIELLCLRMKYALYFAPPAFIIAMLLAGVAIAIFAHNDQKAHHGAPTKS
jgi:hypothetical protein